MSSKKIWNGNPPNKCDLCENPIKDTFVDGKMKGYNSWAIFCPECFKIHGKGLGVGLGQMYHKDKGSTEYFKIEGIES